MNVRSSNGTRLTGCDRIIIVGAGGFGREVLTWIAHAWPNHLSKVAGFLSEDPEKLAGHSHDKPILGRPTDFEPKSGDCFLLAIGIPKARRMAAEKLEARGAFFLTLIHPTAILAGTASVGLGSIVGPYAILSDAVRVGRFVLVNYFSSLGHDSSVGDFGVLSPYAALGGYAEAGSDVFLGMHATVGPYKRLGAQSVVAANSCALADVPKNTLVYGVPGRLAPLLRIETA